MHAFDQAINLKATCKVCYIAHTSAAYANMEGPFGGITSALLLNAAIQHEDKMASRSP